jgi:adenylylsulfate kinase-like enzyme
MIDRPIWQRRLAENWHQAALVWLTGVRCAGKTVLAQSLREGEFINCDLPSSAERLRDPEPEERTLLSARK